MRLLVHDYSGHPFQMQLSRVLARQHEVLHVHCGGYRTGKGALARTVGDPPTLSIESIERGGTFDRYSWTRRPHHELAYGAAFVRRAAAYRPDVILSSNDPLFAKSLSGAWCRWSDTPWVFWLQDLYSVAMADFARSRLGAPGRVVGAAFQGMERWLLRNAGAVVAITDDYLPLLRRWRVAEWRSHVIENWAPVDELPLVAKDNPWARAHGLHDRRVLLYSGTLGLKHDPGLLIALAERFRAEADVCVVIVSEGRGVDWLVDEVKLRRIANVTVLPYQPYDRLCEVLASADVLVALLRDKAGVFSVPSKVLTYLCAGRPLLASVPPDNLSASTIERAGAGMLVQPGDTEGFLSAAEKLLSDERLRQDHGRRARSYAERAFDIEAIAARFETILTAAVEGQGDRRQASSGRPRSPSSRRLGPSKTVRSRLRVAGSMGGRETSVSLKRR